MQKIKLGALRTMIRESLKEAFGTIRGGLRTSAGAAEKKSSGQQFRIGKAVPDENREIDSIDAEMEFPGSVDAWMEVAPGIFPDMGLNTERDVRAQTLWFKTDGKLRVAFREAPQLELAEWDPRKADWFELLDMDDDDDGF